MTESKALVPAGNRLPEPQIVEIDQKLRDPRFVNMLRDVYFRGCDELEMEFCLENCRHLGLDPIAKEIWFVKIWDRELKREVVTPIIGIAGLRKAAHRTGQYGGPRDPQWCGLDGVWRDVWLEDGPPAAARVSVWREGFQEPVSGVVTYTSAVQTTKDGAPRAKWRTAPAEMLAKCAEALAIRRAFSLEVSSSVKVHEVDDYETADDHRFRVSMADSKGLIEQMRSAKTSEDMAELGRAAAALPEGPEKDAARDAWSEQSRRLAGNGKKKAAKRRGRPRKEKPKEPPKALPEPEAQPEHDYGPPPMTDEQQADAQEAFGFGGDNEAGNSTV